jgi:hypothetical protein
MTWMPFSYFSWEAASPTEAKCPFMVMTDGAVGNRDAATEGRRDEPLEVGSVTITTGGGAGGGLCTLLGLVICLPGYFFLKTG